MSRPKVKLRFADFWPNAEAGPVFQNLRALLETRFEIDSSGTPDFLIYSCFGKEYRNHSCVRIFYTGENVRPNFDECDYAFSFDEPVNERNYRLPLYYLYPEFSLLYQPRNADDTVSKARGFCSFLSSNPRARYRNRFFQRLQRYRPVASGGRVLNNVGTLVGDKTEFLTQHKFAIAFENSEHPGYTTEKLLHALTAQTIPIYWGNPRVARDFNPRSFINCYDYPSLDAVIDEVKRIDNDDALYRRYLSAPYFPDDGPYPTLDPGRILDRFESIFSSGTHQVEKNRRRRWFFSPAQSCLGA